MRRRFDYDDEDDQDDLFPDTDDGDDGDDFDADDYDEMIQRSDKLEQMQLNLVQLDLNQRLLFKAMKILSQSWLWKFRSVSTKTKMLAETYLYLHSLVSVKEEKDA